MRLALEMCDSLNLERGIIGDIADWKNDIFLLE